MEYRLTTPLTREALAPLRKGDLVYLSGVIYTARDAAHKRLVALAREGKELPFPIENATIYYVGPTPAKPGQVIGSAGPTTSYRMDAYSPTLIALGETGMIGKGRRSQEVIDAMKAHGAVYFGAIGGAGALLARCIKKAEIVAYEDLGAEAVRRLEVEDMPLVVVIDSLGGNLYETGRADYLGKPREEMKLWTQSAYPEYHKRDTPWDPMAWRSAFLCTHDKHKIRRVVYASTLQAVEERGYTLPDGRHIPLALDPDMDRESKLYAKELHPAPPEVVKDTVVEVVDRDCLAVAKELLEAQLGRVAVLNMANRQTPGGGVYGGSGAQEEYCFRCSDYFRSLRRYVRRISRGGPVPHGPGFRRLLFPQRHHFPWSGRGGLSLPGKDLEDEFHCGGRPQPARDGNHTRRRPAPDPRSGGTGQAENAHHFQHCH